jgi:hypothetical protein
MSLDLESLLRPEKATIPAPSNTISTPTDLPPDFSVSIESNAAKRRNLRAEVLRFKRVDDETGGSSASWEQVGGYFVGVEANGNPSETQAQGTQALRSQFPFTIFFDLNADITAKDRIGVPGWFNAWKPLQVRSQGDVLIPSQNGGNGHFYINVTPGKSGVEEPVWVVTRGGYVVDGAAIWQEAGDANFYEVKATNRGDGESAELLAFCTRVE